MQILPLVEEEQDLVLVDDEEQEFYLQPQAAQAWIRLKNTANSEGIELSLVSAFRSVSRQKEIIANKRMKGIPEAEIFRVSAPAGFSEHHSGRAIDITTNGYAPLEEEFEGSAAFHWLQRRAIEFGFTLSYPRKNKSGIAYEPWHWLHKIEAQPIDSDNVG